ncbi:16S rRNA (uracil(1498)-N(3))-methyltransferase [Merismopedia glauca]|uniref:Ribosomal RNA small subunit methyltransferase E n=1 Tax=Merismopedia glauca CCAP 1448/3 TaxID=1296344 RepID=A0A2T1BXA1_9CYAN|nr:16S rRNA (uracil(1498)-N(3))-methyltransferase [Merismopedia glauca]PSB00621.1 16S rRNA (uracil(1498)-N(3))-methyltransferase [Merismopedia glauca CCAP 1448/3]
MYLQRLAIAPAQIQNNSVIFTPEQYHYLYRVLRLQTGDRFIIMDGLGKSWLTQLQENSAQILESIDTQTELPRAVTLILALPKNGFDEVVRACTELGVSRILPVMSDRTLLNPSSQKLIRWRRIAQEAAEQSERQVVPTILDPVDLTKALSTTDAKIKYICVARGNNPHLLTRLQSERLEDIALAIGSEGGWTIQEVETAIDYGFQPVSLGNRILRAITAPITAMSLIAASIELINGNA